MSSLHISIVTTALLFHCSTALARNLMTWPTFEPYTNALAPTAAAILLSTEQSGFAASVVTSNPDDTTLRLTCTDISACYTSLITVTLNRGHQTLAYTSNQAIYTQVCTLTAKYSAECTRYVYLLVPGIAFETAVTAMVETTLTGTEMHWMTVPITAAPTSASAMATPSSDAALDLDNARSDDPGLSTAAKVGLGIGIGALVALLATVSVLFMLRRLRAKRDAEGKKNSSGKKLEDDDNSVSM